MINKIFAATAFIFSLIIYVATMAPSTSFWDCGEFIGVSHNLGVAHPPGAPLYFLIGNFFSTLFFFIEDIGARINLLSVVCSSLSVTILYFIIVHLIKNWFQTENQYESLSIYLSALTGSLLFAFTDSQWFNAVESEVYAMSMLSTALVVWLTLKWTENRGRLGNVKYIIIIAYIFGLSIGVHPLNLLAIPFVIFIIYFNHTKDDFGGFLVDNFLTFILGIIAYAGFEILNLFWLTKILLTLLVVISAIYLKTRFLINKNPNSSIKNLLFVYIKRISIPIISLIIFAIVYKGILLGLTGLIDQVFNSSNNFLIFYDSQTNEYLSGLEHFMKSIEFFYFPLLIIIALIAGLIFFNKVNNEILKIVIISILMFYIGYSTYATVIVRAHQNPNTNMNSASTTDRFKEYIFREQYGELIPIDAWNIFKYYLGGDKSTDSEKANFRVNKYDFEEEDNEKTIIEGKAHKINDIPGKIPEIEHMTIGEMPLIYIYNFLEGGAPPDVSKFIRNSIDTFLVNSEINSIDNLCGTLVDVELSFPVSDSKRLDNILVFDENMEPVDFFYYEGKDNIYSGCDLPENNLFLSEDGHVLYNTSSKILGFNFEVVNAKVESIGSERINSQNMLSSPNKARWLPFSQRGLYPQDIKNMLSNSDIMNFIVDYQVNEMYFRYFGWQFIGREFDKENFSYSLETKNTKVSEEELFSSNQNTLSDVRDKEVVNSIARYKSNVDWGRYGLPFALIFGILGMLYHFIKDPKNAFSILILFIITGLLIILYINQTDPQPRERDYAYVGSFFAFSIWIGIGCMAFYEIGLKFLKNLNFKSNNHIIVFISILSCILMGVMPLNYLINDFKVHNRSGNFAARDFGYNHLSSCSSKSILLTVGDNDTYPLWFIQEAENKNTDVRVINLSLLNAPWYIEQIYENNAPGNIEFNFDEPYLTEEEKNLFSDRVPVLFDAPEDKWYLDINENNKHDKYETKNFISSLKNDPIAKKMNGFTITLYAIKRWDPEAWADIEEAYFKYEIELAFEALKESKAIVKEKNKDSSSLDLISFINPSAEEEIEINKIENRISSGDFGGINYMKNLRDAYFEFYKDSYKEILKNFIAKGYGYYQDSYKSQPKNEPLIWGKNIEEEGWPYIFPIGNFMKNGFNPSLKYKDQDIQISPQSIMYNGQITLQEFMILKILEDIESDRAVYFTSSVPAKDHFGLDKYMEYQGFVSEVLTPKEIIDEKPTRMEGNIYFLNPGTRFINQEKIEENIFKKYQFTNLNNPDIFYSADNQRHLQEYWNLFYTYLNEFRFYDIYKESKDCSEDIKANLSKISKLVSHKIIKNHEFVDEPLSSMFLINLYYAAEMFEEYKTMLNELIDNPNMTGESLTYILQTLPVDDSLIDYKKEKIKEILNKLDLTNPIHRSKLYEISLYKSQLDFPLKKGTILTLEQYLRKRIANAYGATEAEIDMLKQYDKDRYNSMYKQFIYSEQQTKSYEYIINGVLFDQNCNGQLDNSNITIGNEIIKNILIQLNPNSLTDNDTPIHDLFNMIEKEIKKDIDMSESINIKELIAQYIGKYNLSNYNGFDFMQLLLENYAVHYYSKKYPL